jgi:hypothetical protein
VEERPFRAAFSVTLRWGFSPGVSAIQTLAFA